MTRLAAGLVGILLLAGCAAGQPAAVTSTGAARPSPTPPAGGVTLRELLFNHGPQDFWLPEQTTPTSRIDQPNVVTLTTDPSQRTLLSGWLTGKLPTGWQVDASANDSMLFHNPDWQGAFTCSTDVCALTLRHQPTPS